MLASRFSQKPVLSRWLLHGALVAGFLFLLLDIRFEHREVVGEMWQGWIPIAFSGLMLVLAPLSLWLFEKGGKHLLTVFYLISVLVGVTGVWFHADGKFFTRIEEMLAVWQYFDPHAKQHHHPPILAPLAFMGIGTIGALLIACLPDVPGERQNS